MDPSARRTRRPGGRARAALAVALALVAAAGCARAPVVPPAPPPPPRPTAGYEALRDSLDTVDPAVLRGRRIVLDPGHGGFFRGALGVGGLAEATVNLDVALQLRDLLVARGAIVTMTRTTDRDYLTPADSSLHADLAERMRIANEAHADLFVSIHHNADARGAHDVNEIQTYYRLDDEGPSLDAARAMQRALARNLSIAGHRIIPGGYFVLRNSDAPAILTESSYLTNPDVEAKLASPEKRTLEAEALFLGIAGFFARGAPEIVEFGSARRLPGEPESASVDAFPALRARVRGAFDRVQLKIDGEAIETIVMGDSIRWRASQPFPLGWHTAMLTVALSGAGTSTPRRFDFQVAAEEERFVVDFPGQWTWDGRQTLAVRIRSFDIVGRLIRDPARIRFSDEATFRIWPLDTTVTMQDGVGWAYFRPSGLHRRRRAPRVKLLVEQMPVGAKLRASLSIHPVDDRPRGPHTLLDPWVRTGFALDQSTGRPVRPVGTNDADSLPGWINRDGFVVLGEDSLGRVAVPALAGYRAVAPDTAWPPRFSAIAGGALIGRRIALDPEGGGDDPAGTGASGTRGADLNLDVAEALAAFLRAAGAEVLLTRDGDRARADLERVRAAEAFRAERYLRIAHRAGPPVLGHWFGSGGGRAWGERAATALAALGLPAPPVAEESQWVLQQSSSTALDADLARVDAVADEERLHASGATRAEAYALFLALAREFAPAADFPLDSLEVRDASGRPVAGAPVTLGRALTLVSGPDGRVRFARTEPGPLEAAVVDRRVRAEVVLLDSQRGVVLTGPPAP